MATWVQFLIAFCAVAVVAPFTAGVAKGLGARTKGGIALASVLLGFGAVLDQPAKHAIEAVEPVKGSPDNGEPPLP